MSMICAVAMLAGQTTMPFGPSFVNYDWSGFVAAHIRDPNYDTPEETTQTVEGVDLEGAVRAELAYELWGGHAALTRGHQFQVNDGKWRYLEMSGHPLDTYDEVQQLNGRSTVEVPISELRQGQNEVRFWFDDPGEDWANYWVTSFTLRVFYDPAIRKPPTARVVFPQPGFGIGEDALIEVEAQAGAGIATVDVIGLYLDVDWDGDAVFDQWQYSWVGGEFVNHIGSAEPSENGRWGVVWDNRWVPERVRRFPTWWDRDSLALAAVVCDTEGTCAISEPVERLWWNREASVVLYMADGPLSMTIRDGKEGVATVRVTQLLRGDEEARLVIPTWSGAPGDYEPPAEALTELKLNRRLVAQTFGVHHGYDPSVFDLGTGWLRHWYNPIYLWSERDGHAIEVLYPGPGILVRNPQGPPEHSL